MRILHTGRLHNFSLQRVDLWAKERSSRNIHLFAKEDEEHIVSRQQIDASNIVSHVPRKSDFDFEKYSARFPRVGGEDIAARFLLD